MKNNFLLCLVILSLPFIFTGCEKPSVPTSTSCQVETIKTGNISISYVYDGEERISIQNTLDEFNTIIDFQTYDYATSGKVFIKNKSGLYKSEITLNAKGDAQTQMETYYISLNPDVISITNETEYTYDAEGYILNEKSTFTDGGNEYINVYEYTFVNGELIQSKSKPQVGSEITYNFVFYPNMPNVLAKLERKADFKGLKSKNLLKTKEIIYTGITPVIYTYSYENNDKGNVSTQTISTDNAADLVSTISWKCN